MIWTPFLISVGYGWGGAVVERRRHRHRIDHRSSTQRRVQSSGREATSTWQPVGGVGLVARFASFVLHTVDRSREDNVIMLHHFLKSGDLLDRHLSFAS